MCVAAEDEPTQVTTSRKQQTLTHLLNAIMWRHRWSHTVSRLTNARNNIRSNTNISNITPERMNLTNELFIVHEFSFSVFEVCASSFFRHFKETFTIIFSELGTDNRTR